MLNIAVCNPTELWYKLGEEFLLEFNRTVTFNLGGRRFVSLENQLYTEWPKEWKGDALFELVGYSDRGPKMRIIRESYLDEEKWHEFKWKAGEVRKKGYSLIGMQFKMKMDTKGGCLTSFHLLQEKKRNIVFIHGKVAEVPRKFMADLILVRNMLRELDLWPMEVYFLYSTMYFSIVTLRNYATVFPKGYFASTKKLDLFSFRGDYRRKAIEESNRLLKKYPNGSASNLINVKTGEWE